MCSVERCSNVHGESLDIGNLIGQGLIGDCGFVFESHLGECHPQAAYAEGVDQLYLSYGVNLLEGKSDVYTVASKQPHSAHFHRVGTVNGTSQCVFQISKRAALHRSEQRRQTADNCVVSSSASWWPRRALHVALSAFHEIAELAPRLHALVRLGSLRPLVEASLGDMELTLLAAVDEHLEHDVLSSQFGGWEIQLNAVLGHGPRVQREIGWLEASPRVSWLRGSPAHGPTPSDRSAWFRFDGRITMSNCDDDFDPLFRSVVSSLAVMSVCRYGAPLPSSACRG